MKRRDSACKALLDALSDHSIIKASSNQAEGNPAFPFGPRPWVSPLTQYCAEVHYIQYFQKSKDWELVLHLCIDICL